ncbi:hypothetical protein HY989_03210 [Candidatus Micrarchaeota archaeon]|nr:hypothetical protein [Candidatus Micrarchaeota archaeon]
MHGDKMNINIGVPYESIIEKVIRKGYAGNQTEVIRQALLAYERELDEEEVLLVNKGVEFEMQEIRSGKAKLYSLSEIKRMFKK